MAQLRHDHPKFSARNTRIVVIGPEPAEDFVRYFGENDLPFVGLPDPKGSVLRLYGQEVNLFKLGRMPAQVLVDQHGIVRFAHYGHSMSDIPENEEVFAGLDEKSDQSAIAER